MAGQRVLVFGSYAPSLVHFRGALIEELAKRGHKVFAAAPDISAEIAGRLRELGAEPREVSLVNSSMSPLATLRSLRSVRGLILETRPDVTICYNLKPLVLGAIAAKAAGVKRIVSLITGAGYAFTEGHEMKRRVGRNVASWLYRLALGRSTTVIFQNPDDQALFQRLRLIPPDRTTFVVNGSGIDVELFAPAPMPRRTAFLMIARLLKDKGIREFAAAAKKIKVAHPEVRISLVGYLDPSPDSLTQQELDDLIGHGIDYKGMLTDVRPAIAECSVYVLPSYREGTPRSVLEAMAMGRAIITTDAPGCRETVVTGKNGILVPPRDAEALYEAMMHFIDEPELADRMGPESRKIAEAKYDVRRVNADMLRLTEL